MPLFGPKSASRPGNKRPGRAKCRVFSVRLRPGLGRGARGSPPGAPARPRNCRGEFHKQIVPKSSKKLPNEGPRSTPPLQRVQKAQKHEGLDRATAKTTTLSRIPAWTPPDAERQCYFFFEVLGLRAVGLSFVASADIYVVFWGSFFEIPNTIEKLKPRIAESTHFVGGLAVPSSENSPEFPTLSRK